MLAVWSLTFPCAWERMLRKNSMGIYLSLPSGCSAVCSDLPAHNGIDMMCSGETTTTTPSGAVRRPLELLTYLGASRAMSLLRGEQGSADEAPQSYFVIGIDCTAFFKLTLEIAFSSFQQSTPGSCSFCAVLSSISCWKRRRTRSFHGRRSFAYFLLALRKRCSGSG